MIIVVDAREVDFDTLVHRWIGTTCGDTVTIGLVGDVVTDGKPVILAGGILHGRQPLTSLEFLSSIHARDIGIGRTQGSLIEQLLVSANPFSVPSWEAGLYYYFWKAA